MHTLKTLTIQFPSINCCFCYKMVSIQSIQVPTACYEYSALHVQVVAVIVTVYFTSTNHMSQYETEKMYFCQRILKVWFPHDTPGWHLSYITFKWVLQFESGPIHNKHHVLNLFYDGLICLLPHIALLLAHIPANYEYECYV
jgi:hypothetical protein